MRFHSFLPIRPFIALALLSVTSLGFAQTPEPGFLFVVSPANTLNYALLQAPNNTLLESSLVGWRPNWAYVGAPVTKEKATGDHLTLTSTFVMKKEDAEEIHVQLDASPTSANAVKYTYTLTSDKDVPVTCVAIALMAPQPPSDQSVTSMTITTSGTDTPTAIPTGDLANKTLPATSKIVFHAASGDITAEMNPPVPVAVQGSGVRLLLASEVFKTGTTTTAITYTFSKPVSYLASEAAMAKFTQVVAGGDWFPWTAADHTSPSVFAMDDWLDKPAGKRGGVRMVGDHFQFEDGTKVKFWGTNLAYNSCAPPHDQATDTAVRFARYGVNAVRLHKFSNSGWQGIGDPNDSTQFEPKGLEQLDYFTNQLQTHGVYYGFSHTFNLEIRPGDKAKMLAYDEIANTLKGKTGGIINYAEDIQDLMIQMVVNLLNHTNPYTGKKYADDPALCYIELQNEDDIFWYATGGTFDKCPTYAKNLRERFNDWLTKKYGTQDAIAKAWPDSLKPNESLADKTIAVNIHAWEFTEDPMSKRSPGDKQRFLDYAAFMHDVQDKFYSRFAKAIRDTGYKGPLCGSPWIAPPMVPLYYNLLSDYQVGYIDRHNYFGDTNVNDTMLKTPGAGYLSSGLLQVEGRPFGLSEWITQFPIEYQADGPAIVAAYGMGLQGWDSSYEFTSVTQFANNSWFSATAGGLPFGRWVVDSPVQIGQFPALSRMIFRGDVKEGDVISTRKTSLGEIAADQFSFTDKSKASGDVKESLGSCPREALAAGRCLVQFTDKPEPSVLPDMTKYQKGTVITSNTNQLVWDSADNGFFTINTDGTKAVVGFANGKTQKLGDVTITSHNPYASIILTALDKNATLANGKSALLTVTARAASTDFSVNTMNNSMLNPGKAPLMMEPVKADIAISGRTIAAVNVLDQSGVLTQKTVPVKDNAFQVDSAKDQTLYYQVVFK